MAKTAPRSPRTSEDPYRARLCAQFMAAAAVLAGEAPDDFRRRIIARSVFVYAHEFLRWARRAKNELKTVPNARQVIRRLEPLLMRFAEHDYGPYEEIRHRIGAHRQPFGDAIGDQVGGDEAWLDISDATVHILAEDARTMWNELADGYAMPRLETFPPVSPELRKALDQRGFDPLPEGVVVGAGSFDASRPHAVAVRQGGELGERIRQLVDSIRTVQVLSLLLHATVTHEPYWRVTISALATEAATLVDLLYEQPPSTGRAHRHAPLVELLRRDPGAPALRIVEYGFEQLDKKALAHVRGLRDTIGAHVDERRTVAQLNRDLEMADLKAFDSVLANCFATLSNARDVGLRLGLLRLIDQGMDDLRRVDEPPTREY